MIGVLGTITSQGCCQFREDQRGCTGKENIACFLFRHIECDRDLWFTLISVGGFPGCCTEVKLRVKIKCRELYVMLETQWKHGGGAGKV